MIESKTQAKRKVRDAKILELYQLYKVNEGSLRTVAIEIIANELEVSASTVARITKGL
jgi:DNA-directed RNA polymerase specialized sigma54-like protein